MRSLITFLITACLLHADSVANLKTLLGTLKGSDAIRASICPAQSSAPAAQQGAGVDVVPVKARVEDGPEGLKIFWARPIIQALTEESAAQARDPEKGRPTRSSMDRLNASSVSDYLSAAGGLLRRLESAEFQSESLSQWEGKPAKLLSFKLVPKMRQKDKKYIKHVEGSAQLWLDPASGLPLASESRVFVKGRAMLVISFESEEKESYRYSRAGDRLVVTQHIRTSRNSGAGESGEQKSMVTLSVES